MPLKWRYCWKCRAEFLPSSTRGHLYGKRMWPKGNPCRSLPRGYTTLHLLWPLLWSATLSCNQLLRPEGSVPIYRNPRPLSSSREESTISGQRFFQRSVSSEGSICNLKPWSLQYQRLNTWSRLLSSQRSGFYSRKYISESGSIL